MARGEAKCISMTLPIMSYFVGRMVPSDVCLNVLIPQGADHDSYAPTPGQMMDMHQSVAYISFGTLDFETTWRNRLQSVAPNMAWYDMNSLSQTTDPHYWTSPREALLLTDSLSALLKNIFSEKAAYIDSATESLRADIRLRQTKLNAIAEKRPDIAFCIYHPALSALASEMCMTQIAIEHEGNLPSSGHQKQITDEARSRGARVVFVQAGYDESRVETLAREIGAEVVGIDPEGTEWTSCMDTIISTFERLYL